MGKKLLEFWTDDKKAIPAFHSKTPQVFFGKPAQFLVAYIEIDRGLLDGQSVFLAERKDRVFSGRNPVPGHGQLRKLPA